MTTSTLTEPGTLYCSAFEAGTKHFLATFGAVPDDKLNWKPSETAKSAFEIGTHAAAASELLLYGLQDRPVATDFASAMLWINERGKELRSREDVVAVIEKTRPDLNAALMAKAPQMQNSEEGRFWLELPARHADGHASQIDFLQTCWGDHEEHFG